MPKQFLKINDFSGGMVDAYDPRDLKPNQFSRVENFMLDKRSSLDGIGGEKIHQDIPSGDEIVLCPGYGLFVFDSDHDKGTTDYKNAKDDGEHWMAILDAVNADIDLFNLSIGSVKSGVIDLGTPRTYTPGLGPDGVKSAIQVLAPSDTIIVDSCGTISSSTAVTVPNTNGLKVGMFVIGNGNYLSGSYSYDGIVDGTKITDVYDTYITIDTAAVTTHASVSLYFSKTITSDTICTTSIGTNFKYPDGGNSDWRFKVGDIVNITGFSGDNESANAINNVNALRVKSVAPATAATVGNKIALTKDSDFNAGASSWVVYDEDGSSPTFTNSSAGTQYLSLAPTTDTTGEGVQISYDDIWGDDGAPDPSEDTLLNQKWLVTATLYHESGSGTIDDFRFSLCGIKSHGFTISNTSTNYSAVLDLSHPSTNVAEGLKIYAENSTELIWRVDNVKIIADGSLMTFDESVLYRTDRTTNYYGTDSTQGETGEIVLTLMPKVIYHFADEALRIMDTTLSTGVDGPQMKWRGYVKREQFSDASSGKGYRSIDGWVTSDNKLAPPTFLHVTEGSNPAYDSNYKGGGWAIGVVDATSGSGTVFGTWLASKYQFACTFIYDGNQESILYVPSANNVLTVDADASEITLKVEGSQDADGAGALQYDDRISGGRIYVREDGTDNDWQLFVDIDIVHGVRVKPFGDFTVWTDDGDANEARSSEIISFTPNIDTYETLNGFSQDEKQLHIAGGNEGYRTSVIANRRCFVANMKTAYSHPNLDANPVQMRDRIMYSPMNRFDTFPRNFFIDVVKGDAEEYIKLEEYADRLLAFKQRRLHIVNIQDSTPNNWFLEDIKDFAGIAHYSASVKTEFGICWVNEEGCFIYDGRSVKNLILNKIAESSWEDFVTNESSIFYNPKKFYIGVLADYFGGNSGIYMYDFRTQSWIKGGSTLGSNQNRTNYVVDWNGNAMTVFQPLQESWQWNLVQSEWVSLALENDNILYIWSNLQTKRLDPREWGDDYVSKGVGTTVLQTKDYDFGEPSLIKKVYSVTITYASGNAHTSPISYATDGGTSFTAFTGDFTGSATATGWKKLRATLSSPVECQSIAIKIANTSPTGTTEGLKINDISLEYRVLRKRVS